MDSFTDQAQAVVIGAGGGIGGALAAERTQDPVSPPPCSTVSSSTR